MESILKKLYYDTLSFDDINRPTDPKYSILIEESIKAGNILKEKISDEDYKIILNLFDIHNDIGGYEAAEAFVNGFKYGSLMMLEILSDK
jgi:hypothetical protein